MFFDLTFSHMNSALYLLNSIQRWDVLTFRIISSGNTSGTLTGLAKAVSFSGNGYLYPLIPIFLFTFGFSQILEFVQIATIGFAAERSAYSITKNSFKRRRPANVLPNYQSIIQAADEFSFPSGHTSAAFFIVSLLLLLYGPVFMILSRLHVFLNFMSGFRPKKCFNQKTFGGIKASK